MELELLKKKLSTFKTEGGKVTNVSDDLLLEILDAWENWGGSAHSFYKAIGSNHQKMASMMGKAKKMKREGHTTSFQEVKIEGITETQNSMPINCDIEVQDRDKIIRFRKVDLLIEFLKKSA
jgi:hypothetical protein